MAESKDTLVYKGTLNGHTNSVTAIATPMNNSDMIVTSSLDERILVWSLTNKDNKIYGDVRHRLYEHNDLVHDVTLSSDGKYALSGSSDNELRLWDLASGLSVCRFIGHTDEVLSVAFSLDDSMIVSASRDKSIKIWNIFGQCGQHIECGNAQTCVKFIPNTQDHPVIASSSWDKTVRIWNLKYRSQRCTMGGHNGPVNAIAISPDGILCASGTKNGEIRIWDVTEGVNLYNFRAGWVIYKLCFSPIRNWICAATHNGVMIFDLDRKLNTRHLCFFDRELPNEESMNEIYCTSLSWSADGNTLFSGYSNGVVRVWALETTLDQDQVSGDSDDQDQVSDGSSSSY